MTPLCSGGCGQIVDLLSLEDVVLTRTGWAHPRCLTIKRQTDEFCPVCGGPCFFPQQAIRPSGRINS
jgi:hypothetical protein